MSERSLFDELGGEPALRRVIDRFVDRLFDDVWGAQRAGMRAVHIPLSAIPSGQLGHTEGTPDGVIHALADLPQALARL